MAPRRPWTAQDDTQLTELHSQDYSMLQISRQMDRSRSVIQEHAATLGLSWDHRTSSPNAQMANAVQARNNGVRERRLRLKEGLMDDAERLRGQMFARTQAFNFGGKDNTFEEHEIEEPTHADKLKIMQGINTALGSIEKIERLEVESDTTGAISMLDGIARAVQTAADQLRERSTDDWLQELI